MATGDKVVTLDGLKAVYDSQDTNGIKQDISDLKSSITDMNTASVETFPLTIGHMLDTGKWGQLSAGSYKHFVYPVSAGDIVKFKCTVKNTIVAFVTDYSLPLTSATVVNYSTITGFTSKIAITKDIEYAWIVPSDARYVIVEKRYGSTDVGISVFSINGYNFAVSLNNHIVDIQTAQNAEKKFIITWEKGAITASTGLDANSNYRIRTNGFLQFNKGVIITVPADMELYLIEYHADQTVINKPVTIQTTDFFAFPTEAGSLFRLFGGFTDHRTTIIPSDGLYFDVRQPDISDNAPMWYALGDSLVQGFYSTEGQSSVTGRTYMNYPAYAAIENGWKLVNYGTGGAGYIHVSETWNVNAKQIVDSVEFAGCDICTLAFGVNDWHYSMNIGTVEDSKSLGTTMASNMKYVIEKILSDNPLCRLNIILPMNCSKYGGTFETDWGLGTSLETSGTLQHVVDVIKGVADLYHLPVIDQTKTGIVNRFNITGVLPDGIHPSMDTMKPYGKRIAKQII